MLLDLLFPQVCGFCGKINRNSLCKKCEVKLKKEQTVTIEKFKNNIFDEQIYFFEYGGFVRNAIIRYKFRDKAYIYESFVNFMIKNKKFLEFLKSYDIIIPVPISRERYKTRGYNQSLLISRKIANSYNKIIKQNALQVVNECLYKNKNTIEQSKLDKNKRATNAHGVYILKNEQILKNKRILIIDDIYTTGSTINECSQMIKKAKPTAIGVFTIAKDL